MKIYLSFLLFGVVLISGCASKSATFTSEEMLVKGYGTFKTYAFLPTTDTLYAKMINRQLLVPAMAQEAVKALEKKGLKLDTLNPDALFTYHLVMNRNYDVNQEQVTVYNPQSYTAGSVPTYQEGSGAVSGGSYQRGGTAPGSNIYYFSSNNRPYTYGGDISIDTLREGSMVIDMIDAKSHRVVWRSVVSGASKVSQARGPEEAAKYFIPRMLKSLPRK